MAQTIEQLEGEVWDDPQHGSHLVMECHRLRKKPIDQFTVEEFRIMIGQDVGTQYLVPLAVDVLEKDPLAEGSFYPGDLLKAVVTRPKRYWKEHPEQYGRMTAISTQALNLIKEMPEERAQAIDEDLIPAIEDFCVEATA